MSRINWRTTGSVHGDAAPILGASPSIGNLASAIGAAALVALIGDQKAAVIARVPLRLQVGVAVIAGSK
jgi:hypothetical protein